jgi:hypothetical protein
MGRKKADAAPCVEAVHSYVDDLGAALSHSYSPVRAEAGRVAGYIGGDIFVRFIDPAKHILYKYNALATDVAVLEQLKAAGVKWVMAVSSKDLLAYVTTLDEVFAKGKKVHFTEVQRALPLKSWRAVPTTDGFVRSLSSIAKKRTRAAA